MNYRTERWPVVTFSLIGINTLVWLITLIYSFSTDGNSDVWIRHHLWLAPATSPWYSWITSMFVHAGTMHLLGNMLYLFLFGCCAEDLIGRWRFLAGYLVGGFVAELFYIAASPLHFASTIPLGGASGAIAVCMGMYLMLRANADIVIKLFYFVWLFVFRFGIFEFEIPAWMAIGLWFSSNFCSMLWDVYHPGHGGGVAFASHVGGLLAGLGFIALSKLTARKRAAGITTTDILSPEEIKAASSLGKAPSVLEVPTIYLHEDGAPTGPFTLPQIQARLAQCELDPETRYWSEGMSQWESVTELADNSLR